MSVKLAAERLGVSESLVYEWCKSGQLAHFRFGRKGKRGKLLIEEKDLETFLAACKQEARRQTPAAPLNYIKMG